MSRFVWELNERLLHGHVPQIRTARDLLHHLGVTEADQTTKDKAVRAWLKKNEPDALMAASLKLHNLPSG